MILEFCYLSFGDSIFVVCFSRCCLLWLFLIAYFVCGSGGRESLLSRMLEDGASAQYLTGAAVGVSRGTVFTTKSDCWLKSGSLFLPRRQSRWTWASSVYSAEASMLLDGSSNAGIILRVEALLEARLQSKRTC